LIKATIKLVGLIVKTTHFAVFHKIIKSCKTSLFGEKSTASFSTSLLQQIGSHRLRRITFTSSSDNTSDLKSRLSINLKQLTFVK